MKYSLNLLKKLVPALESVSVESLPDLITTHLAEVEDLKPFGKHLEDILVVKVLSKSPHPRSEKLFIVKVTDGKNQYTVVTAASNFQEGDFLPFTPVGKRVPVNMYPERFDGIIRKMKLAGVMSEGMLNSAAELGLWPDHEGLLVLNDIVSDQHIGMSLARLEPFNDYILDIENKALTHRGDVLSHTGLARELAAILGAKMTTQPAQAIVQQLLKGGQVVNRFDGLDVKIQSPQKTYAYYLVGIQGQKLLKESGLNVKLLLFKLGVIPRGQIVDLTNLSAVLYGQPMHAFDVDKLTALNAQADNLVFSVDFAKLKKFKGVDGKVYSSDKPVLSILVNNKVAAVAGVMGGEDTSIDESTQNVLLEIAVFDNISVRRSRMELGILSLASDIFSRRQDPTLPRTMTESFFSGQKVASYEDTKYIKQLKSRRIDFDLDFVRKIGGIHISAQKATKYLKALGMDVVVDKNTLKIKHIPLWRLDLNLPEDIVEELIRLEGYDKIVAQLPNAKYRYSVYKPEARLRLGVSSLLATLGGYEHVGFSFVPEQGLKTWGIPEDLVYKIVNAKSPDVAVMRPLLSPWLIEKLPKNRDIKDPIFLYEVDKVFNKQEPEHLHVAFLVASPTYSPDDLGAYTKHVLDRLLYGLAHEYGIDARLVYGSVDTVSHEKWAFLYNALNPYARSVLSVPGQKDNNIIGVAGILGSHMTKLLTGTAENTVFIYEIDLTQLFNLAAKRIPYQSVYGGPVVIRDYAFIVDSTLNLEQLDHLLKMQLEKIENIEDVLLSWEYLDVYQDKDAFTVTIRLRLKGKTCDAKCIQKVESTLLELLEPYARFKGGQSVQEKE